MSILRLPTPGEQMVTSDGYVTQPWYAWFDSVQKQYNTDYLSTGAGPVFNNKVTVITSTTTVPHALEVPDLGTEATIIFQIDSTNTNAITVFTATNVAIGPGGENALQFDSTGTTYGYVKLLGTSTVQYHVSYRTTNVSIVASS